MITTIDFNLRGTRIPLERLRQALSEIENIVGREIPLVKGAKEKFGEPVERRVNVTYRSDHSFMYDVNLYAVDKDPDEGDKVILIGGKTYTSAKLKNPIYASLSEALKPSKPSD